MSIEYEELSPAEQEEDDVEVPQKRVIKSYTSIHPNEWRQVKLPAKIKNITPPFQATEHEGVVYIAGDMRGYITTLDTDTFCVRQFQCTPTKVTTVATNNSYCCVRDGYLLILEHSTIYAARIPSRMLTGSTNIDATTFQFVFLEIPATIRAPPNVGLVSATMWGVKLVCFGGYDSNATWTMDLTPLTPLIADTEAKLAAAAGTAAPASNVAQPAAEEGKKRTWLRSIEWNRLPTNGGAPPNRFEHCSITLGNHLIVFGGKHARGDILEDGYVLNLQTGTWNKLNFLGDTFPKLLFNSCIHKIVETGTGKGVLLMYCFGMRLGRGVPYIAELTLPLVSEPVGGLWKPASYDAELRLIGQTASNNLLCVPSYTYEIGGATYFIGLGMGECAWNATCFIRANVIPEWRPYLHSMYTKYYKNNTKTFLSCCQKLGFSVPYDLCGEIFTYLPNELSPQAVEGITASSAPAGSPA